MPYDNLADRCRRLAKDYRDINHTTQNNKPPYGLVLLVSGFLVAAAIGAYSLRGCNTNKNANYNAPKVKVTYQTRSPPKSTKEEERQKSLADRASDAAWAASKRGDYGAAVAHMEDAIKHYPNKFSYTYVNYIYLRDQYKSQRDFEKSFNKSCRTIGKFLKDIGRKLKK